MASTYDPGPPLSNRNFVRLQLGDISVPDTVFSDEEIDSVLLEETSTGTATKWFASATMLSMSLSRYSTVGQGKKRKKVDDLSIDFGLGGGTSVTDAINALVRQWRIEGQRRLLPTRRLLRSMNSAC